MRLPQQTVVSVDHRPVESRLVITPPAGEAIEIDLSPEAADALGKELTGGPKARKAAYNDHVAAAEAQQKAADKAARDKAKAEDAAREAAADADAEANSATLPENRVEPGEEPKPNRARKNGGKKGKK